MPSDAIEIVADRAGLARVWRRADVSLDAVVAAVADVGETLKRNDKSHTKRAGDFVVKTSEGPFLAQLLKHTFRRARYRRGWRAALYLEQHGVPAPRPVAHVEWGIPGLAWRHATITEFIPGCRDVEQYYDAQTQAGATPGDQAAYLARLANAVNALGSFGARHTDLAGKNILTRDGETFCFIDLDAIAIGGPTTGDGQLQLHVQLYDSFVDRCDDDVLAPFLRALRPAIQTDFDAWFARVKTAQAQRRARTVAAWKREGRYRSG